MATLFKQFTLHGAILGAEVGGWCIVIFVLWNPSLVVYMHIHIYIHVVIPWMCTKSKQESMTRGKTKNYEHSVLATHANLCCCFFMYYITHKMPIIRLIPPHPWQVRTWHDDFMTNCSIAKQRHQSDVIRITGPEASYGTFSCIDINIHSSTVPQSPNVW